MSPWDLGTDKEGGPAGGEQPRGGAVLCLPTALKLSTDGCSHAHWGQSQLPGPPPSTCCFRSSPLIQSTILWGESSLDGIIEVGLEISFRGIF